MDIEKLIEQYRQAADKWEKRHPITGTFDLRVQDALRNAATALSTLQAENKKLRAELEQVKQDRDALIDDFVDYVTDGVPNPAIFCKNRCDKCTDMRGWCTGKDCKGFYPSGASGQKED